MKVKRFQKSKMHYFTKFPTLLACHPPLRKKKTRVYALEMETEGQNLEPLVVPVRACFPISMANQLLLLIYIFPANRKSSLYLYGESCKSLYHVVTTNLGRLLSMQLI